MNFPEPDDVLEQLFAEFLTDQKARLSLESYFQYAEIIDLFNLYLDRYYRPECLRREYDTPARSDRRFGGLPPAVGSRPSILGVPLSDFPAPRNRCPPREAVAGGSDGDQGARRMVDREGLCRSQGAHSETGQQEQAASVPSGLLPGLTAETSPEDVVERRSARRQSDLCV